MASKFLPKYPVPEDFPDILHKFAREVLRDQPENIYEYGAQYFRAIYEVSLQPRKQRAAYVVKVGARRLHVTVLN